MITEQEWLNYVETQKSFNAYIDSLYNLGIDVSETKGYDAFLNISDLYISKVVNQDDEVAENHSESMKNEAIGWINWWLYESCDKIVIIKDGENENKLDLKDPIDFYDFMKKSNYWAN